MDEITVAIPTNFTDAGRLLGMFRIRNTIEAVLLTVPIIYLCLLLPFGISVKITAAGVLTVVIGGFALIGVDGYSLLEFVRIYFNYRKRKGILTYRGCADEKA